MIDLHTEDHRLRWQSLSLAEREAEYSPSSVIGGHYQPYIDEYRLRSAAARAGCDSVRTLRYASGPANLIDFVAAEPTAGRPGSASARSVSAVSQNTRAAPLVVFIHGGYWQEGSRTDSLFGADVFVAHGIAYAALGYTLAPQASLARIVSECRAALQYLFEHAEALQIDARRVIVAGSSAGAQLAAICCCNDTAADQPADQPADQADASRGARAVAGEPAAGTDLAVAGLVLLSGIFALEPLLSTYVNERLGMDLQQARRYSPMDKNLAAFPATIVSWGERETAEFKRQSLMFASQLRAAGVAVDSFESARRNHFDIVHDLADRQTRLGGELLSLIRRLPA